MCPSTEAESSSEFAAAVLRNLLVHITEENTEGIDTFTFVVSHGWTDGPTMYLVYKAPPSTITWALVRDTPRINHRPRALAFSQGSSEVLLPLGPLRKPRVRLVPPSRE